MNRTLFLFEEISENSVKEVCKSIVEINNKDDEEEDKLKEYERKPIKLYIDSIGGLVYPALSLISAIRTSKTPIHTICNGYAMSAAALIFMVGHKRFITENSIIMIHQMSCGLTSRKYLELVENIKELQNLDKQCNNIIFKYSKISENQLLEYYEKKEDWYLRSEDIIKFNIADEIIEYN